MHQEPSICSTTLRADAAQSQRDVSEGSKLCRVITAAVHSRLRARPVQPSFQTWSHKIYPDDRLYIQSCPEHNKTWCLNGSMLNGSILISSILNE